MQADKDTLQLIEDLNKKFENGKAQDVVKYFLKECKRKIALSSSLGAEDQVLTEMVANIDPNAKIFTLDTGRLFPETYNLISETNKKYNIKIEVFFPDYKSVEGMVKEKGINLFYESVENRKLCCHLRKIEPAKRAFEGLDVWICGLRKEQSLNRFFTKMVEWDEVNNMIKVNPLLNWSEKEVWDYIKGNQIPYNKLHDKGFPSIGCQPCTRAIKKGEDVRAGRWWWAEPEHSQCGLHGKEDFK